MATYFQKTVSRQKNEILEGYLTQKNKILEGYLQTEKNEIYEGYLQKNKTLKKIRGLSPDRKMKF